MIQKFSYPAFAIGLITAILLSVVLESDTVAHLFSTHNHEHGSGDVHFHADLAIIINGELLDLSKDKYMSTTDRPLTDSVHLHDNNPNIIHFHADGITLPTFLNSIGLTLTDDCLTLDTGEVYCSDEENQLVVKSNGAVVSVVAAFFPGDEDQILVFYGANSTDLSSFTDQVTDEACIYSLTCPERGAPPPEGCGLTCEL